MTSSANAESITKGSKSNLALALIVLPKEIRGDMTTFYAFCRIVDDIADEPSASVDERKAQLDGWRRAVVEAFPGEPALAAEVRGVIAKYRIPVEYFHEIIAGVEMDFEPARYRDFAGLRLYCYRVASAVGLVSIEIFGCTDPASKDYAINLGLALQLTNIIRDVGEDWGKDGRVYLPLEDLERFGYTLEDLAARKHNAAFEKLMRFQAERARSYYALAEKGIPRRDTGKLVAAEIMRSVYKKLLVKIERDGFHVLERRHSLGKGRKISIILQALAVNYLRKTFKSTGSSIKNVS